MSTRLEPGRPSIRLSPSHSRQNSAASDRNGSIYQQLDPLLNNLSPESTLHALTSTAAVPSNEKAAHDILSRSISQVSPAERALGIRAAVAAQNLNLWHKEVQSWSWPNQNDAKNGKAFIPPQASNSESSPSHSGSLSLPSLDDNYYGSLHSSVVERNEKRIEEIRDGMEDLNVEELKEHVLNAHIPSRSRPSSATSSVSVPPPLSYIQLSDFTAVVTATILRALPHLSRLNALLSTWDVRLLVLRQIPGLLRELSITRSALDTSLCALRHPQPDLNRYSDASLSADHVKLESAVIAVGRRMDRVLDALEGRPDSLPEEWIDHLESIEADFAAWVVEAEQYKVHSQWLRSKANSRAETPVDEQVRPATSEAKADDDHNTTPIPASANNDSHVQPEDAPQCRPAVSPIDPQEHTSLYAGKSTDSIVEEASSEGFADADSNLSPAVCASSTAPRNPNAQHDITCSPAAHDSAAFSQFDFSISPSDVSAKPSSNPSDALHGLWSTSQDKENIPPLEYQQIEGSGSPFPEVPTEPHALSDNWDVNGNRSIYHTPAVRRPDVEAHIIGSDDRFTAHPANEFTDPKRLSAETVSTQEKNADMSSKASGSHPPPLQPQAREDFAACKEPIADESPKILNASGGQNELSTPASPTVSPLRTPKNSDISIYKTRQSVRGSQIPLASPKSGFNRTPIKPVPRPEENPSNTQKGLRKPLQSPIKLSESRHGKLGLGVDAGLARKLSHRRRTSTGSVGSLLSDHSSLVSSPDAPEPRTASSNETQPEVTSLAKPNQSPTQTLLHTLREDRLRRFETQKPGPRVPFSQNRAVSLPLERFINERLELGLAGESAPNVKRSMDRPVTSSDFPKPPKSRSRSPAHSAPKAVPPSRLPSRRNTLSRGKSSSGANIQNELPRNPESLRNAFAQNTARRAIEHQSEPKSTRLRKQLTSHPSLETLGVKRQQLSYVEEHESEFPGFRSRPSSPNKYQRQPRDHLDEKISSILNSLPGHIHLVDPSHEADTSSSSSSVDRIPRHRSQSPCGPPPRSTTPAPSLMLMSAARKRNPYAYKAEDSCVKLYHLHHGGQSAPTKLFVRTVGEEGQRVMVRVGGGWADLGEYLREYVIHHGRRKVSETPRVEVQGIKPRLSPPYTSPIGLLTPSTSTHLNSNRATPSGLPSVLSARPPSSLTVHKKRRGSTISDVMGTRAVTTGHLPSLASPLPNPPLPTPTGRRMSVSSGYSVGDTHPSNSAPNEVRSTPLGLAGPRPRARYESMSPEGEAWVEDVLNKTRHSSSHHPPHFTLGSPPFVEADDRSDFDGSNHFLPKVRSIGDIGSIGTSRRVVLRGLGSRRP